LESLTRKKKEYMPPTFMSVSQACQQLLKIIRKKQEDSNFVPGTSFYLLLKQRSF